MQKAAALILEEQERPMTAKELAAEALRRHLVTSRATRKIESLAGTLTKNIRTITSNDPELKTINGPDGTSYIGLPGHNESMISQQPNLERITIYIPSNLKEKVTMIVSSDIKPSEDDIYSWLLESGIEYRKEEIREHMNNKMGFI